MSIAFEDDHVSEVLEQDVSSACELDPNAWLELSLLHHSQLPNKPVDKIELRSTSFTMRHIYLYYDSFVLRGHNNSFNYWVSSLLPEFKTCLKSLLA
jgi:hypothetical protein